VAEWAAELLENLAFDWGLHPGHLAPVGVLAVAGMVRGVLAGGSYRVAAEGSILEVELVLRKAVLDNQVELTGCKAGWGKVALGVGHRTAAGTGDRTVEDPVGGTAVRTEFGGHCKDKIREYRHRVGLPASSGVDTVPHRTEAVPRNSRPVFGAPEGFHWEDCADHRSVAHFGWTVGMGSQENLVAVVGVGVRSECSGQGLQSKPGTPSFGEAFVRPASTLGFFLALDTPEWFESNDYFRPASFVFVPVMEEVSPFERTSVTSLSSKMRNYSN